MSEQIELTSGTWQLITIGKNYTIMEIQALNKQIRYSFTQNDTTNGIPIEDSIMIDSDVYLLFLGVANEKAIVNIHRR